MPSERVQAERTKPGMVALVAGVALGFVAVALASALVSPWAFELVEAIAPGSFPFQRVVRRATLLLALVALALGLRAAGVRRVADVGLAWSGARGRAALVGALWAAAAIVVAFAAELALGHRTPSLAELAPARVAKALAGGAAVGLLEEGICRGALLFPFAPLAGGALALANGVTSALYATAHFLRGVGRAAEIDAWSGFRVWAELPGAVGDHVEAWVGLFLTGAVLYRVAARQGHAWGAVGAHAGAVFVLQLLGTATAPVPGRDALFLVDGLLPGWGLSALLLAALAVLLVRRGSAAPP